MKYYILLLVVSTAFTQSCKKSVDVYTDISSLTPLSEWNEAPFNAFTDLVYFKGNYYCAFREGKTHTSSDGKIRIVSSADGRNWVKFSLLSEAGKDLREPHFFVDGNNFLSLGINAKKVNDTRQNVIYKLKNGTFIRLNEENIDNDYLLWSYTKFKDSLYSIGYNLKQFCFSGVSSPKPKLSFFKNTNIDCTSFGNVALRDWINENFICPSEASMVFTNDSTLITIIRDENSSGYSHLGVSKFPFTVWHWQQFPYFVRGPKLAVLPNGHLFLCAGSVVDVFKTYYLILDPANNFSIEKIRVFPSDGDNGYPGVIIEGNTALISYYSSHEGNARVYIDRITY